MEPEPDILTVTRLEYTPCVREMLLLIAFLHGALLTGVLVMLAAAARPGWSLSILVLLAVVERIASRRRRAGDPPARWPVAKCLPRTKVCWRLGLLLFLAMVAASGHLYMFIFGGIVYWQYTFLTPAPVLLLKALGGISLIWCCVLFGSLVAAAKNVAWALDWRFHVSIAALTTEGVCMYGVFTTLLLQKGSILPAF